MSRFNLDVTVRRSLQGVDQCLAGVAALEASELFGGNDDNFIATMDGDVLRPLAAHQPHQLAEARLGVLE
jgi:hypothetical protein